MRLAAVLALLAIPAAAAAQPQHRLFLTPTARTADRAEVGSRWVVPSVEAGLGRGVSVGVTGLVLPNGGEPVGAVGADARVALVDREGWALAAGAFAGVDPFYDTGSVFPSASGHVYAVATAGGARGSASLGLGVRATSVQTYPALEPPGCPACLSYTSGPGEYGVRVLPAPVVFGGAEAVLGTADGPAHPIETRVVAEGLALPMRGGYAALAVGGLRVRSGRVHLDAGGGLSAERYDGRWDTALVPWIGLGVGL